MQASLSQSLSSLITPEVIGQASTALDEPPAAVSRAMSAVFPVLLKGLSLGVRQPRCLHTLFALATHKSNDDRLLSNVGELLAGQSPTAPTRLLGDKMLHALFGNHIGIVAPPIAEYAGIEERSSETLLHAAAQLVLADLGRRLRATGQQTPASLSQLVTREATGSVGDNVLIPAGWSMTPDNAEPGPVDRARVTSTRLTEAVRRVTSPITSRPAPENGDRPTAPRIPRIGLPAADNRREKPGSRFWTWIWLPIIGAMALAFVLLNSPDFRAWWSGTTIQASLPRPPSAGPRLDSGTTSTQRPSPRLALDVPEESVEARVIRYIESTRPLATTDWFELDRLTFQSASNALTTASMVQVLNIAAILNAYPTVRLKIGGYTDNVGDSAANLRLSDARANTVMRELANLGIAPERLAAEGYGEQHPIGDNATSEGRARNRRIAFRVTQR